MKPGSRDVRAYIKFTFDELDILQANTHQMAESFGLDSRIRKLTGKRKVGFYSWDLDCLECVISCIKEDDEFLEDKGIIDGLELKIKEAMRFIEEDDR